MKKIKIKVIDKEKIFKMYNSGMGTRKIATHFPFSRSVVIRVLKELDVSMNNKPPTKYEYDYEIFEKINNRDKAYWLGFLYADGFVSNTTLGIRLAHKDKNHLLKFKEFMKTSKQVVTGEQDSFGKIVKFSEIRIYSSKIVEDLISLGCVEHKSKILTFPNNGIVPKEFISDFIRGYFDGDGSISTNGKNNGYKISIIGTKPFLQHIKEHYQLKVKILESNGIYELKFGGKQDVLNFINSIYENSNYKLNRKYKKSMMIRDKISCLC